MAPNSSGPRVRRARAAALALLTLTLACGESGSPALPRTTPAASDSAPGSGAAASAMPSAPSPLPAPAAAATWRRLSVAASGPSAREDHTWTVAGDGSTAYLYGGRRGTTVLSDLWAYDLTADAWRELRPPAPRPAARFGHNAAWVSGIGLVVFAGQAGQAFFNDLWAYDPLTNRWRRLPATGAVPVPRYGSCAALGHDARLWISHGFTEDGRRFADTRAYDFATSTWTDETPSGDLPVSRCLHACWWTAGTEARLVLYAGQTTGVTALGDLWILRVGPRPGTNAWSQVKASLPPARNLYAAARLGAATWVFGGQSAERAELADLWRFDDAAVAPNPVASTGAAPPGRHGAELVADQSRHRLLLFGGKGAGGELADLWELSVAS